MKTEDPLLSSKHMLRMKYLERRNAMTRDDIESKSALILLHTVSCAVFMRSRSFMCYLSFGNEVPTDGIIAHALKEKKTVYAPRIHGRELELYELISLTEGLETGPFGIRQPGESSQRWRGQRIDMAIVPGIVFDVKGNRIGFGKGYFDRFLAQPALSGVTLAGLAYRWQIVDSVPSGISDRSVRILLSEEGMHECDKQ